MVNRLKMRRLVLFVLLALAVVLPGRSQVSAPAAVASAKTRVLLILNCSHSMWDPWQTDSKINVTQKVLLHFLDSIAAYKDVDVALRVFGHLNKESYGTNLEVPFEPDNNYRLQSKIKTLVPNGGCIAASALDSALNDFPKDPDARNIIIIITDGIDDTDGDICQVARRVQLSGIIVQTFILGIGNIADFSHSLDCAGTFSFLSDEVEYTKALYDVFRRSEQKAQVCLEVRDAQGSLFETELPLTFYDAQTHVSKFSTLYSVDSRFTTDTFVVDPLVFYDVALFTRPVTMLPHQHFMPSVVNRLPVVVSQGRLRVQPHRFRTQYQVPDYQVVVRSHADGSLVAVQQMSSQWDYLEGLYDLDILSQPMIRLSRVEVRGGNTTDVEIPMPGLLNLSKPKTLVSGTLFVVREGRLEPICTLDANKAIERLVLMPGDYQLVYKPQQAQRYADVVVRSFSIVEAKTTAITID